MTEIESYYDWKLKLKNKPDRNKRRNRSHDDLGMTVGDFKRFVKFWKSKNIIF
ncbi:MAG: hypothetical protein ACFFEY_10620 [Candidatus Thorarchaeota archaeon]